MLCRKQSLPAAVLVVAMVLTACDNGGNTGRRPESTATSDPPGTTSPSSQPALPGERVETAPYPGARLAVVGVAAGDKLNVRSGPGTEFPVILQLHPLSMTAAATGHNRSVGEGGVWSEITVDDRTGWARTSFLLQPGQVTDITAGLFPTPADRPTARTMEDLGRVVAGRRASAEPPSDIVIVDGPRPGDVAEITVDVIGLGDDAHGGERLKIFAHRDPPGRFTVRTVEATALCSRGVGNDGLCV